MFKLARRLVAGVVLVVLLLVVAGAIVFWRIDMIAKRGIERGSSYALGVPTTLNSADVGILGGTLTLDGLNISNPRGFDSPTFLSMGDGRTTVSLATLRKDTIVIPELWLENVDVNLIRRPGEPANYQVILDNLEKLGGEKPSQRPPGEPAAEKRLIVNELVLRDITISADLLGGAGAIGQAAGQLGRVTIPIDEVRLTDVGRTGEGVGGSGVTIGELAGIVVEAVLAAAAEEGGDLLPPELLGDLRSQLAQLGNIEELGMTVTARAQELGDRLREAKTPEDIKGIIQEGAGEVEKLREGLEDVLPKRKRE